MKAKRMRALVIVLCFLLSSMLLFACQGEQGQDENQETEVESVDTESIEPEAAESESVEIESEETESEEIESEELENTFLQISASEAKGLMEGSEPFVLLDVRNQDEFEEGHIEGALLIPLDQIAELAPDLIPDKEVLILVYCRSGRRSVEASQQLVDLGYTQVVEFGGILDWPYEVVKD